MPVVSIRHRTTYRYRRPVSFGEHRMMLRPAEADDQRLVSFELEISPTPWLLREVHDAADAIASVARFEARSPTLTIESRARVEHAPRASLDLVPPDAYVGEDLYEADERAALGHLIEPRHGGDDGEITDWGRRFLRPIGRTHAATWLGEAANAIRAELDYEVRLRGAPQSPRETLARGRGSCRDFATLMIAAARRQGFAARFASGYVYGEGSAEKQRGAKPRGDRQSRGHTHAWAQVFLPGGGWVDYDPTNGLIGGEGLIRTAAGPEPILLLPLHGSYRGRKADFLGMEVEIDLSVEAAWQPAEAKRVAMGV